MLQSGVSHPNLGMSNRVNIYYWKCDRPDPFSTLGKSCLSDEQAKLDFCIEKICKDFFKEDYVLEKAVGQGNHRNFVVRHNDKPYLIRIESGSDNDDYMVVETEMIRRVGQSGIPVPEILHVDTSRTEIPYAYQIMECLTCPDINTIYKNSELDTAEVMKQLGGYIARWQSLTAEGFGFFDTDLLNAEGSLRGLCGTYPEYYRLRLDDHLTFLVARGFIGQQLADEISCLVTEHEHLLDLESGCLVHKDIAFWNILGTENEIVSVIDWDDTIMGDPTDDLSLMACYHSWEELAPMFEGYTAVKPLTDNFEKRFWLHLLRNMIFKAVIRVGAGYFDKDNNFFLVQSSGANNLKEFTLSRILAAVEGLKDNFKITDL